jgi:hypothetical protein
MRPGRTRRTEAKTFPVLTSGHQWTLATRYEIPMFLVSSQERSRGYRYIGISVT